MAIKKTYQTDRCLGCSAEIVTFTMADDTASRAMLVVNLCKICRNTELALLDKLQTAMTANGA